MEKKIPCLDLKGQHQQIKQEVFEAFEKVYENTAFSGGPFVETFEKNFAQFCGTKYAVGVDNGTSALQLAMLSILMIGFGITNISLGIIAEYLWRTLDASRKRQVFIIDEIRDLKRPEDITIVNKVDQLKEITQP